nr:MFS transporter [Leucobacter exalbidus]
MLALGVAAQAAGTMLVSTPVYLIPMLHLERGMPLVSAGTLASAPTLGMVLTLVMWGYVADRFGERWVISGGLALTAVFACAAAATGNLLWLGVMLGLAGGASASTNAASGRVVVGWFPKERRGLAMGIRQMSQPLGVAVAALVVPPLAEQFGMHAPLLLVAAILLVLGLACMAWIENPPRKTAAVSLDGTPQLAVNPYLKNGFLARIHAVSMLLVLPQFALTTFGMVYMIAVLHWSATAAGLIIGLSQFIGAIGRIAIGALSDRLGNRVGVLRWVALSAIAAMLAVSLTGALDWQLAGAIVLVIASTITVADNGLAYTSVAEGAGTAWVGRALGIQNTGQFIVASAVGPGLGALIAVVGYPVAFALVAIAPLVAVPLIPKHDQHSDEA